MEQEELYKKNKDQGIKVIKTVYIRATLLIMPVLRHVLQEVVTGMNCHVKYKQINKQRNHDNTPMHGKMQNDR